MSYQAVFSLGSYCAPAHQIGRFFQKKPHSCFDWLVTPFASLLHVLEDDGANFCDEVSQCFGGHSALCARYGVLYHHEFERDEKDNVVITPEGMKQAKSKLTYKYHKMMGIAKSHRTLFVRYGSGTDAPGDALEVTKSDLQDLEKLLRRKLGHSDFALCYVHHDGYIYEKTNFKDSEIPQIAFYRDTYSPGVLGTDEVWDAIFTDLGFDRESPVLV